MCIGLLGIDCCTWQREVDKHKYWLKYLCIPAFHRRARGLLRAESRPFRFLISDEAQPAVA